MKHPLVPVFYTLVGIMLLGWLPVVNLYAQTTRTWVGPANGNWSVTTNWSPNGNPAGARLVFAGTGSSPANNDQTGQIYNRLTFTTALSTDYTLTGNAITLADASVGNYGWLLNENNTTNRVVTISAPLIFDDVAKIAAISTRGVSRFQLGNLTLGNNLLSPFRIGGDFTAGSITIAGSLTGNKEVHVGLSEIGDPKVNTRVVLSGDNNAFSGLIRVQNGVLQAGHSLALGISPVEPVDVRSGAALELLNNITLNNRNFLISGRGIGNTGALRSISGINTIQTNILVSAFTQFACDAGTLTLGNIGRQANPNSNWNLLFSGNGAINVNGTIGQINGGLAINEIQKTGAGILTISGVSSHVGTLNISASGVVRLGGDQLLPATSPVILSGATLQTGTSGFNQTFGMLTKASNTNSNITLGSGAHTLTFASSRTASWTGTGVLVINGWQGPRGGPSNPGTGRIFIESPDGGITPGLTDDQLAQIRFNTSGYCQGAELLPSGELVPSTRPFISTFRGSTPAAALPPAFQAYVNTVVNIDGCGFTGASQIQVGSTLLTPPNFSINNDTRITFTLQPFVSGLVNVSVPVSGSRTHPTPLTNLGNISIGNADWQVGTTWQGNLVPTANVPTVVRTRVSIPIALINKPSSVQVNTDGRLSIGAANSFSSTTNVILNGGQGTPLNSLRTFLANSTEAGTNQVFGTIDLRANATIALGSGNHRIDFANSSAISWSSGRILTITNWKGNPSESGTEGKIFVGNDNTGLTSQQLAAIKFQGFCGLATLLSTGELVPSGAPFIQGSTGTPGGSFTGFTEGTLRITGCQFTDVTKVFIGGVEILPPKYSIIDDGTLDINLSGISSQGILRLETVDPLVFGESSVFFRNLGHITTQNGLWNDPNTWLGGFVPPLNRNVNINNRIEIDGFPGDSFVPDTITIATGGELVWQNNTLFKVAKAFINNGKVTTASGGVLQLDNGSALINNGVSASFDSEGLGTVVFTNGGTIGIPVPIVGSPPIIFHNLTLNGGTLTFPLNTGTTAATIPTIEGTFQINGGNLPTSGSFTQVRGPRYAAGSKLVYASGGDYIRGREWYSNGFTNEPGFPWTVEIINNTRLRSQNSPDPNDLGAGITNLIIGGDLNVLNGEYAAESIRPVDVRGSLQLGDGPGSIGRFVYGSNTGFLTLFGDYTRYVNSVFDAAVRRNRIVFSGNSNTSLSTPGETITPGVPTQSFPFVVVNTNKTVTLNTSIAVEDSLHFTSGYLGAENGNVVLLKTTAGVGGGNAGSFVIGAMAKETAASPANATGPFEFKIGKQINASTFHYRPVTIADLAHSGTTTYTAEYFPGSTTTVPPFNDLFSDPTLEGVWDNRWWEISKSGSGAARVGIPYTTGFTFAPFPPPVSGTNVAVARFSQTGPSDWSWGFTRPDFQFNNTLQPFPESRSATDNGMVYSARLSTFSPFTIGFGSGTILPVTLLSFTAHAKQADALLQWEIADNKDLKGFDVEHSLNGQRFSVLTNMLPAQTTLYHYTHQNPGAGVHYYRLKIADKDGSFKYSKVEVVQFGTPITVIYGLIQNPVAGTEAKVKIFSATPQAAQAVIMDMSGRVVLQQKLTLANGENLLPVSVMLLPKGFYKMAISTQDGKKAVVNLVR